MKASEVSDEGLAAVLRAIAFTSNLLSDEKEYVQEAAERLEKLDRLNKWMQEQYET